MSSLSAAASPSTRSVEQFWRGEAPIYLGLAIVLLIVCVPAFLLSTVLGLALAFGATLFLAIALPSAIPTVIVASFLLQNMVIASFTPLVASDDAFDTVRGVNFVILVTCYGAFLLAIFLAPQRLVTQTRPWLFAALGVFAVILFYFALGIVRGEPKDAVVYFRNTLIPIACFHVALVAASQYRVEIVKTVLLLGSLAIVYGYCELFFTFDFLRLFNGDQYVERQMARQIATGAWEQALRETGFVLRNLNDVMTTTFFNTPFFADIFPKVFRLAGPNFHPISFAYALSIVSVFLLFQKRWLLPILALPLLLVIGSKGAIVLLLFAIAVRLSLKVLTPNTALMLFFVALGGWVFLAIVLGMRSGDYHVLGFFAGIRDFAKNPLGQGLGLGGNLSSTVVEKLDWNMAQATGATEIAMESAVGVMLYQMGIGAIAFFAFLVILANRCRTLFLKTGNMQFLFGVVGIGTISANAVLQEEAFYSPLALGFCLLLVACVIGTHWKAQRIAAPS
jgi:hypothetical protein